MTESALNSFSKRTDVAMKSVYVKISFFWFFSLVGVLGEGWDLRRVAAATQPCFLNDF